MNHDVDHLTGEMRGNQARFGLTAVMLLHDLPL